MWILVTCSSISFLQLWRRTARRSFSLSWWAVAPKSQRSPSSVWLPSRDLCPMRWCLRWVSWLLFADDADSIRSLMLILNKIWFIAGGGVSECNPRHNRGTALIKHGQGQQGLVYRWLASQTTFFFRQTANNLQQIFQNVPQVLLSPHFHCPFGKQLLCEINERLLLSSWSLLSDWRWLLWIRVFSALQRNFLFPSLSQLSNFLLKDDILVYSRW